MKNFVKTVYYYYTVNLIMHYIFFALVMIKGKRPMAESRSSLGPLETYFHVYALKGEKAFRSSLKFRCHTYN